MDAEPKVLPSTAAGGRSADLTRVSPRVRKLLEAACTLCDHWAEPTLQLCLERFDKRLYEHAEQSRNHLEQQRCFDSRNLAQHGRSAFMQTFIAKLRESFERMGLDDDHAAPSLSLQSLTLLDRNEHELTAALDKLAARSEAQNGAILSELSYRLAVLVAAPPLEGKRLPPGPQNMARILRVASEPMNLPIEHRLLLLQEFENSVGRTLVSLYEGINAKLLADGILPQLRAFAAVRPPMPAHASAPAAPATASTPVPANAAQSENNQEPIAVLETLRDLLTRQRAATGSTPVASGRSASPEELQTALSALQQHVAQVTDRTSRELRSAQRLQEELVYQLNQGLPAGTPAKQLTAEQGDTVELVTMLFEQLAQQLHQGSDARALLGGLQLPLLRLAVADGDFFNQREHPARQLLGKLADTLDHWVNSPNGEVDHQLLGKLNQLVDRAQQEAPTPGLYTSLLADIEHHLGLLVRKAQTAERRHVEAMQGRERLEQARQRADALMTERFAVASPRGLLRTLLERAWTDVLALNLLRHGEDSDVFLHHLRITDQLLGRFPVYDARELRHEVETGLQQIGMHADEAEQVAQRLITVETTAPAPAPASAPSSPVTPLPAAREATRSTSSGPAAKSPLPAASPAPAPSRVADPPSATDLAIRLKQRQRLGELSGQEPPTQTTQAAVVPPLGLREARIHNHLRQLPFGTWFEFTDPATGTITREKLAWFSPVSGNSLFVNRRGQRSDVMNLQELARAIADGRVRELPPQQEGLLDRAWHALTNNLLRPASPLPEARA